MTYFSLQGEATSFSRISAVQQQDNHLQVSAHWQVCGSFAYMYNTPKSPEPLTAAPVVFWPEVPYRDLRIYARARNEYLKAINEPQYWDADLLIVLDTDMCMPWDVEEMTRVINSLMFPQQQQQQGGPMDAIYAYGSCGWYKRASKYSTVVAPYTPGAYARYCDLFALQDINGKRYVTRTAGKYNYLVNAAWREQLVPKHGWVWQTATTPESYCESADMQSVGCTVVNGEPVVPVQAAFGGFGIFRATIFRSDGTDKFSTQNTGPLALWGSGDSSSQDTPTCTYDSDGDQCEHVPLGLCLHKQGYRQAIALRLNVGWEKEACKGPVRDKLPALSDMEGWGKSNASCACRSG